MAEGVGDVVGLVYDPIAGGINYAFDTDIKPLSTQIQAGLQNLGFPKPEGTYEEFVAPIARGVTAAVVPGSIGRMFGKPLTAAAAVGGPAIATSQAGSSDPSVATPEDFQFGMGAYEPLQLPTPEAPQAAGFDFSRRAQALQEKEAYMQRAMQLAGIDAYLSGNPSQLRTLQAEYAQLGNERALVAGVNALQAATMGDITPLRQFLADQYGTGDVQIYPMADGTLEIEVNGQSFGRTTLADIRQQLLADLDPATQQAAAAQVKFQQELFLKLAPEELKAAQARGEIKDARFIEPADTKAPPFLYYNRGGINYMVPMTTTTIGGVETIGFGEERPVSEVR
jgi:hypothetical protein